MRAYSLDLPTHLVNAVRSGLAKAEAAHAFGVSVRTIDRYLKQLDQTGALTAKPLPGPPRQLRRSTPRLPAQLTTYPDATVVQQCRCWAQAHGGMASPATMRDAPRGRWITGPPPGD